MDAVKEHNMNRVNSAETVGTQYRHHLISCPFRVPTVPFMSLQVHIFFENMDFEMSIKGPCC